MKKYLFQTLLFIATAFVLFTTSCKDEDDTPVETLFDRLGGSSAVEAAVDQFLANVLANVQIKDDFEGTIAQGRAGDLRQNLIDQICEATGGPCTYTGLSMAEAHAGLNINDDDFTALVGDLISALQSLNVGQTEIDELVAILAPLQGDIVESATLFDALGGVAAIESVVDAFLGNVLANPAIAGRFTSLSSEEVTALRQNLIDQVSDICGSSTITYTGEDMQTAHAGLNITDAEFDALVGDLVTAVTAHNLPADIQARIEAELYPPLLEMRPVIVGQ